MTIPDMAEIKAPKGVVDYPSMTTDAEKALLYWLARDYYAGEGIIVDAGIFLGASTNAFATGLSENKRARWTRSKPICSYDIAVWVASMDRYLGFSNVQAALQGAVIQSGDSFEPVLRKLLRRHMDVVDLHIGDIVALAQTNHPVEIAFYDCLKTNDRDIAVFRAFAPHYIPGRTVVLQQDFFYESAACNKIRQEYFSQYFKYLGQVSTTAAFLYQSEIPADMIRNNPVAELSLQQGVHLLERAASRANDTRNRILTRLSTVDFLIEKGDFPYARDQLANIRSEMATLSLDELTRRPQAIVDGFNRKLQGQG